MTAVAGGTAQLMVLLPAVAALLGILVRSVRPLAGLVAVAAGVLTLLVSIAQFAATAGQQEIVGTLGPLSAGGLDLPLHLLSDRTSAMVGFAVALVGLAVQVFSIWYLHDDPRYPVFAATVSLFLAGMLLVVMSGDLVLTLIGWEVMGWCSFLLIGHVSARESARRAAYKAFMVTRVADIGFVLGLVILAAGARSTDLAAVLQHWVGAGRGSGSVVYLVAPAPALTAALLLLLMGVAGKSGLVPFHDWLPDAMEGPTPASALIHAATMVAAGTFVVVRLQPLYAADDTSRTVLGVLAALTMVYAALLAFAQSDVKRLLAYSTLSQVAIMLSALAFGTTQRQAEGAALGHLFSHALFKSLLFLAVGWLSVLAGGTAFVALRGRARGRGALEWSIGIGLAALAGVPPLVGFFSKEGVLAEVEHELSGPDSEVATFLLVVLLLTIALTAAYATRAWLLVTTRDEGGLAAAEAEEGQEESDEEAAASGDELATGAHEARPITLGAAVTVAALAALTVVGGLLLVPIGAGIDISVASAVVSVVLVVGVFFVVRTLSSGGRDLADRLSPALRDRAERGFGVDAAYVAVGRAVLAVARLVATLDRDVVDAYPRAVAAATGLAGRATARVHRGSPSTALVAVVVGVVLVAIGGVTVWR